MNELWAILRDPRVSTVGVLLGVLAGGFALMWLGYRSVAALPLVPQQMSYVVSGGIVGLALVGTALLLLSVHVDRVEAATERRILEEFRREALRMQGAK